VGIAFLLAHSHPARSAPTAASDGRNLQEVLNTGIRAIVQLAMEEPLLLPARDLVFCRFPLLDGIRNDPVLLKLAIDAVATLQTNRIAT
jgi:hypothetical protein